MSNPCLLLFQLLFYVLWPLLISNLIGISYSTISIAGIGPFEYKALLQRVRPH